MINKSKISLGQEGEEIASAYLKKHGYKLVERNFRCKLGEIDIIAREGNTYIFIEVKTRKNLNYGYPIESINYYKRQNIIKTAQYYIKFFRLAEYDFRFDAIEIYLRELKNPKINHIKNIITD